MKLLASDEGAHVQAEFMKNATFACLSVDNIPSSTRVAGSSREETEGRLTSLWRLACIVNYRRTKWLGPKVLFDPETEDALDSLDSVMQCPQQVVFLAGKQLEHEYLTKSVDRLIANGMIPHDKKEAFLAKLGPYPQELEPLKDPRDDSQAQKQQQQQQQVKRDEL